MPHKEMRVKMLYRNGKDKVIFFFLLSFHPPSLSFSSSFSFCLVMYQLFGELRQHTEEYQNV
jgi:hypothetical protein